MTYTEAIFELTSITRPLQSKHEKWLSEVLLKRPLFVTDNPNTLKPFYMRMNDGERTIACFDILVPFAGELVGGSLREERSQQHHMASHGPDPTGANT